MSGKINCHRLLSRRDFFRVSGCGIGLGLAYLVLRPKPVFAAVLPPGALPEKEFRATCLRCGRCAAACDRRAIRLNTQGLPYIDGLHGWCDFCARCVEACPAGALKPVDSETARIGVAVIDRDRCIAWNWIGCRICAEVCAELREAIWLDDDYRPHVSESRCNGCGACIFKCPQSDKEGSSKRYGRAVALHRTSAG